MIAPDQCHFVLINFLILDLRSARTSQLPANPRVCISHHSERCDQNPAGHPRRGILRPGRAAAGRLRRTAQARGASSSITPGGKRPRVTAGSSCVSLGPPSTSPLTPSMTTSSLSTRLSTSSPPATLSGPSWPNCDFSPDCPTSRPPRCWGFPNGRPSAPGPTRAPGSSRNCARRCPEHALDTFSKISGPMREPIPHALLNPAPT